MTDETTPDVPQDDEQGTEQAPEGKHKVKHEFREVVGKVVGIAVETGSMLSGNSGDLVSAESALAEADAEKFLDRIDGEG
jgi:hypothetical protein